MRFIRLIILTLCATATQAQQKNSELERRIHAVENSLSPAIVYGDSLPAWNLEERMKATGIKGLSIAVIRNYQIEWAKGYGWADEAAGKKVTTDTRFQAASISKSINSLGVLKLVEQGKLDPEADINQYLKSWTFPYDSLSKGKKISANQLLSHTAGLGIHGFPGYSRWNTIPSITAVLDGKRPANTKAVRSVMEPGRAFRYSGGGTTITQLLVMDITGQDYAIYMESAVLGPLGMLNSSFRQPATDSSNLATGYYGNGKPVAGKYHVYPEQAAAGLWTTPSDLARYVIECQLAYAGNSAKVLSPAMMRKRLSPYIDSTVGLGVMIEYRKSNRYFNHNGGNEAFLCTSYGSLLGGDGVVIMTNGENFSVISELVNSVARVYGWKDFYVPSFRKIVYPPESLAQQLPGTYRLNEQEILIISRCGKDICIRQGTQSEPGYTMRFTDESRFEIAEVPGVNFLILKNDKGAVEALQLTQRGVKQKLMKIK